MSTAIERAAEAGYRPGATASTNDGNEVVLVSFPYTDGSKIWVLGRSKPDDSVTWKEFRLDELVLRDAQRTPVVPDE